jgi:multidrug efflux pump subunit AcrA (membrane-fusion protein)
LLVAVTAALAGCGLHGRPKERKEPAAAAPAPDAEAAGCVVAPGIVEAWGGEIAVAPREPGWIATIVVEEGQTVAAGQALAVLDDEVQREAVGAARAEVAEAEALLARIQHGATVDERRQARAEALASDARATLARRDAVRLGRLGADRAVAPAEVDRADTDAEAQAAMADAGRARLASIEHGARPEDRRSAAARTAAARARLELAEAGLARRRVVAPTAGTVLASRFHAGEYIGLGGEPLFVIGDLSRLRIRLEVDEIDAPRVAAGASCAIYGDNNARLGDGTVFRIAPRMGRRGLPIDTPTARADVRVREVFVEVPAATRLVPGQRVWGHATPARQSSATFPDLDLFPAKGKVACRSPPAPFSSSH